MEQIVGKLTTRGLPLIQNYVQIHSCSLNFRPTAIYLHEKMRDIYLVFLAPKELPPNRPIFAFLGGQLFNRLDEVVRDFLRNDTVMLIARVTSHELSDPFGSSPESTVRALSDQVEIAGQEASRFDIYVDAVEVRFHQWNETWERPVGTSVDDIRDTHQLVLGLDWAQGGRWWWCVDSRRGGGGERAAVRRLLGDPGRSSGEGVFAEVEFLVQDGVASMGCLHVLGRALDGNVEIEIETQNGPGDQHDEDAEGCVFEIRDLDLHGAELDSPANIVLPRWRWLESHVLPVGGLEVLKVIYFVQVELFQIFREDDQWIANEEVCEVCSQ